MVAADHAAGEGTGTGTGTAQRGSYGAAVASEYFLMSS